MSQNNKQDTAKIVVMKMAERMNQPATAGSKHKGVTLVVIDNEERITADGQTGIDAAIKETAGQLGMTIIAIAD
jgi:hypothetical protein